MDFEEQAKKRYDDIQAEINIKKQEITKLKNKQKILYRYLVDEGIIPPTKRRKKPKEPA